MPWFSLVIGQNTSRQLATSSENVVAVSRNFEPYNLDINTSAKSGSDQNCDHD